MLKSESRIRAFVANWLYSESRSFCLRLSHQNFYQIHQVAIRSASAAGGVTLPATGSSASSAGSATPPTPTFPSGPIRLPRSLSQRDRLALALVVQDVVELGIAKDQEAGIGKVGVRKRRGLEHPIGTGGRDGHHITIQHVSRNCCSFSLGSVREFANSIPLYVLLQHGAEPCQSPFPFRRQGFLRTWTENFLPMRRFRNPVFISEGSHSTNCGSLA